MTSLTPKQMDGLMKVMKTAANWCKLGLTEYNPTFMVSNIIRDFGTAWYNTETGLFHAYVGSYFAAMKEAITHSEDFKRYLAMGGGKSSMLEADRAKFCDLLTESLHPRSAKDWRKKIFSTINPFAIVRAMNNIVEITPRFMEFKAQLKETGDVNTAIYKADDITTNFKRRGQNRSLDAVFMFSNAQIQGLDRLWRSFKDATLAEHATRIVKYTVTALIMTALQSFINRKDDDTKEA